MCVSCDGPVTHPGCAPVICSLSFLLFDIQPQIRSRDARFLLAEDGEEEAAVQAFTRSHFTVWKTGKEQTSAREPNAQGERGGGENSRWMLSGLRGQRVLH